MYKGVPSPRRCANPKPSHLHHTATDTPGDLLGSLTPERGSWNPGGGHRSRRAAGGRDIGRGCRLRRPSPETPEGGGFETDTQERQASTDVKAIHTSAFYCTSCVYRSARSKPRERAPE